MTDRLTDEMRAEMRAAAEQMSRLQGVFDIVSDCIGVAPVAAYLLANSPANVLVLLDEIDELRRERDTAKAIAGFEAMRYENEKKDNAALRAEMKEMAAALEPFAEWAKDWSEEVDDEGFDMDPLMSCDRRAASASHLRTAARVLAAYRERNP